MRAKLLALALAAVTASPSVAEPVLPFAPFLLAAAQRQPDVSVPSRTTLRTGSDSRDIVGLGDAGDVRPMRRPAVLVEPVRTAGVARKISRLPWSTGVFQ